MALDHIPTALRTAIGSAPGEVSLKKTRTSWITHLGMRFVSVFTKTPLHMKLLTATRNCKEDPNALIKTASLIARSKESELNKLIGAITTTDSQCALSEGEKGIAEKVLAKTFVMLSDSKNTASESKRNAIINFFNKQESVVDRRALSTPSSVSPSEKSVGEIFNDDFVNVPLEEQLPQCQKIENSELKGVINEKLEEFKAPDLSTDQETIKESIESIFQDTQNPLFHQIGQFAPQDTRARLTPESIFFAETFASSFFSEKNTNSEESNRAFINQLQTNCTSTLNIRIRAELIKKSKENPENPYFSQLEAPPLPPPKDELLEGVSESNIKNLSAHEQPQEEQLNPYSPAEISFKISQRPECWDSWQDGMVALKGLYPYADLPQNYYFLTIPKDGFVDITWTIPGERGIVETITVNLQKYTSDKEIDQAIKKSLNAIKARIKEQGSNSLLPLHKKFSY